MVELVRELTPGAKSSRFTAERLQRTADATLVFLAARFLESWRLGVLAAMRCALDPGSKRRH